MSEMTTEERIEKLAERFSKEMSLWPDPFEAPSVPDKETLEVFEANHAALEPDLDMQIRSDINCRRALNRIECDKLGIWDEGRTITDDELLKILEHKPDPTKQLTKKNSEKIRRKIFIPRKGDIFYTQSKLPVVNEKGELSFIYTFKPCAVLLFDNGKKMPWGDKVFKCTVVTSGNVCKTLEGHDIDLGNGWVLHKWLRYKVSVKQLDLAEKAGEIADAGEIDRLMAEVKKYSVEDVKKMPFDRERRRLFAMAKYVPILADTEKKLSEMEKTEKSAAWKNNLKVMAEFDADSSEKFCDDSVYEELSAAGDRDTSFMLVRKVGGAKDEILTATPTIPIFLMKNDFNEENLPKWSFDYKGIDIPDHKDFVLRDANKNRIGVGYIYHATGHGVAKLVEYFPDKLEDDITSAEQVILEVYI